MGLDDQNLKKMTRTFIDFGLYKHLVYTGQSYDK